jgi:Tol biopolymer transport system component
MIGRTIGPYRILEQIGAGGMGVVYRARDERLERDVALKVLPDTALTDEAARRRIRHEALALSRVSHPHIATVHDVGVDGDVHFIVMEYIPGENLSERLVAGPLPEREVIRLGRELASGLDAAHRSGVIHRDLKPGNVMLTKSGAKLMDFGLARPTGLKGAATANHPTGVALTQSPTVAAPLTAEGTIVGTFQYMPPEQLEGKETDARSDIWSLGCVLYEMATGKRAFEGKSQASLIAAVMNQEPPPASQLATLSPPALDRLIQACLAKDPDDRIQTAHDIKLQLGWIAGEGSQVGAAAAQAPRAEARPRLRRFAATALTIGLTALVVLVAQRLLLRPAPVSVLRFSVPVDASLAEARWPLISPDGRTLVFMGTDSAGASRYWLRSMDALDARPLPVEHKQRPFWSGDGRSLGYIAADKLRRMDLTTGADVIVADAPGGRDGSWGDGVVLYDGSGADSISRVTLAGGKAEAATRIDRARGESGHGWPAFLPDGRHFLFTCTMTGQPVLEIKLGTLGSLESRTVGHTDTRALFADGYLLSTRGGTLLAQRFDAGSGRTSGEPVALAERVEGDFSVSRNGMLVYRPSLSAAPSRLVWMDRSGRILGQAAPPDQYLEIRLSPDGTRVAVRMVRGPEPVADIWICDLMRGVTSRVTFGSSHNVFPVWSPDGSRIAYSSNRGGEYHTLIRSASGSGADDSLAHEPGSTDLPSDWSADGRTIVISRRGASGWDVWLLGTDPGQAPNKILQSRFNERSGRFSPDGRWLAYASNESGRYEIYVVPLAGGAGKWQVSTAGGDDPFWRKDGRELLYLAADHSINAVAIGPRASFEPGTPQPLFRAELVEAVFTGARWCPTADAQRFLLQVPVVSSDAASLNVVSGWPSELAKKK